MNDFPLDLVQSDSFPKTYHLRVRGRLGPEIALWFEDMTLTVDEDKVPPETVIQGEIRDQSSLYGLISRIRDLGLILLSVASSE